MESAQEINQAYQNYADHASMYDSSPNGGNWSGHRGSVDDEGLLYHADGGESQSGSAMRRTYSSPKFTRRSMDDSLVATDARMNRIANAEAAMRQEIYKECTFRPNIKDLPIHYGAKKDLNVPFHTRVTKWQKEKVVTLETKSKTVENNEKAACTFHPKINRNSDKAVKEIRGPDFVEDASERLYKNSVLSQQQKAQVMTEIKMKEAEKLRQECTFKPKLVTRNTSVHQSVQSKFTLPTAPKTDAEPSEMKNCTFTPKINKLRPNMSSAKLYVSTDVVERLSRPGNATTNSSLQAAHVDDTHVQYFDNSTVGDRPVMDMASFMGSIQPSRQSTGGGGGPFDTPGKGNQSAPNTEAKAKRDAKFEMFLARQQANLKKREDTVKQIQRSTTPVFKPQLARRAEETQRRTSVGGEGVEESKTDEFVRRMQREAERRLQIERENALKVSDQNCTFQPKINKGSESIRGRSIYEMSVADHQRKENNRRALRLEAEQNELVNMTFTPEISKLSKAKGKSVLQLSSDNSQFLDWLKQSNLKKEQKRLEILREREEKEAENCTFSPKTTECPAYVKRIALSMSIVKAARNNTSTLLDSEANKPQWR